MLFEVVGVSGHTGMRIHSANIDDQLDRCIATGLRYGEWSDGSRCILQSKKAFEKFMELQKDVKEFKLIVESLNSGGSGPAKMFDKKIEKAKFNIKKTVLENCAVSV